MAIREVTLDSSLFELPDEEQIKSIKLKAERAYTIISKAGGIAGYRLVVEIESEKA